MEQLAVTIVFIILMGFVVWLLEAIFSFSLLELIISFFFLPYQLITDTNTQESSLDELDCTPSTGVVIKAILPPNHGQIKYSGSFWRAVAEEPIDEETIVQVLEKDGLILQVRPVLTDDALRNE